MEPVIGIDLGTTNSEVAVCRNGKIEIISMDNGSQMLPSVVGMTQDGHLLVGTGRSVRSSGRWAVMRVLRLATAPICPRKYPQ